MEGVYKASLNTGIHTTLHVFLFAVNIIAWESHSVYSLDVACSGCRIIVFPWTLWGRSIVGSHGHRVLLYKNRACSVNNCGKLGTKNIWTSDKQSSYAPKCKHLAKLSGTHVSYFKSWVTISKKLNGFDVLQFLQDLKWIWGMNFLF